MIALSKREETALDDVMLRTNERLTLLSEEERKRVVRCLEELTLLKLGISEAAKTMTVVKIALDQRNEKRRLEHGV